MPRRATSVHPCSVFTAVTVAPRSGFCVTGAALPGFSANTSAAVVTISVELTGCWLERPARRLVLASVEAFLIGFGMGIVSITGLMLVQESVEWSMRGSATSSVIFSRSLGNTLGATTLGAVLSIGINHCGSGELAGRLHTLLNEPSGPGELAGDADIRMVLFHALYLSFWGVVLVATLAVISIWLIPKVKQSSDEEVAEAVGE